MPEVLSRFCVSLLHYFKETICTGTEVMDKGDIMAAIKLLTKCVQLRSKALYKAHPDLGKSADKLAQCYAFIGI